MPLQYLAKQMTFKEGNTFSFVALDGNVCAWFQVYASANDLGNTGFGTPGFISSNVPGPIIVAPGVTWTGSATQYTCTSWNYAALSYVYLQKQYPALFSLASINDSQNAVCGCRAEYVATDASDPVTSSALGTLQPLTIGRLFCPGYMSNGMCIIAESLTIVDFLDQSNVQNLSPNSVYMSHINASRLGKIVSIVTSSGTTAAAVGAGQSRSPNKWIMNQIEGKIDYIKLSVDDIARMIQMMVVATPSVLGLSTGLEEYFKSALGDRVPVSAIFDALSHVGYGASKSLVKYLAGKYIGVSAGTTFSSV